MGAKAQAEAGAQAEPAQPLLAGLGFSDTLPLRSGKGIPLQATVMLPSRPKGKHRAVEALQVHVLSWLEGRNQEMENLPLTAFGSWLQGFVKTHVSFKNVSLVFLMQVCSHWFLPCISLSKD